MKLKYKANIKEILEQIKLLSQAERDTLVVHLIPTGIVDYKAVSDGYIGFLKSVRQSDIDRYFKLQNATLQIVTGSKKDISRNVVNAWNVMDDMGTINPVPELIKKWRK